MQRLLVCGQNPLNELPRGSMRRVVNFLGTCANVADRLQARREIGLADTGRVEGRRVTGRESVAHLALSLRAAVRRPWARFLPLSPNPACRFLAPGSPVESCVSYTELPGRGERSGVAYRGTRLTPLHSPAGASSALLTP